ncbi:rod shape-determining protein MreC [Brevibacillus sp. B_LB10_24]|uniref:rod shape-determining protein MreC n=1 Tax=Brevibacillus sp. B_LB10_24 TaxID=3380645 RepID=UPI0038B98487
MSFFGNKRLIILLVGLVLLISVIGFTSRERASLTWPEKFLKDTFSVVQGFFYRPAQAFSGFLKDVEDAYNVYQENRQLKANLDEFAEMSAQLKLLETENERLRALLQAKSQLKNYEFRVAEVVARNMEQWNDVITIDKGSKNGIKKDMAVISSSGLVGRVKSVANFSSTVELLTAANRSNHISALILGKPELNGIIDEYDPREHLLIMRKIPLGPKIQEKAQVVTSGLGGVTPKGLLIGEVVRVEPGDYGLTQTAYIKPSADFSQLNEVLVVERAFVTTGSGELVPSSQVDASGQTPPSDAGSGSGSNTAGPGGGR